MRRVSFDPGWRLAGAAGLVVALTATGTAIQPPDWLAAYRDPAARLIAAATADAHAWQRIAFLTDTFGARFSGTPNLAAAVEWAAETMRQDGLENVRTEPVMVPRWVRGQERLELLEPVVRPLVLLGLGGSVGTPAGGIDADAIVVSSFEELDRRSAEAKGRIVVFDVPYVGYGPTVQYRSVGASRAARHGAVAMLLRSVGPMGLRTPHTGALNYDPGVLRIPAAAIPVEDSMRLARMQARGQSLRMRLVMDARTEPDVESANVVGEIRGRERPEEIVLLGGHFDSWDVGTGAMDDGGGSIVAWEAVRLMKALDLRPRRTVRVVLFANEENGLRGGLGYRDRHTAALRDHVLTIESDTGVFRPLGFGFTGSPEARARVMAIASLLAGIGADRVGAAGGGADIGPSVRAANLPSMSLDVDGSKYFLYHHTPADTVERLDPEDVAKCTAAMAVMAYVVADLPERLPNDPSASR
jgi:carboxypeptidase Q